MRIRCELLGCRTGESGHDCHYCGANLYDGEYIERGRLDPLLARLQRILLFVRRMTFWPPRCEVCGKRLPRRQWESWHCDSRECFENWMPF